MERMFRLLRADEIDVRVGTDVQGTGVSLLLYKDARCDMNILDETVGPLGWTRSHTRDNANCIVSVYDEKKAMWISKEDTGTESRTEAEKGLASDSFKRACVNFGIGRELYTAPFIWIGESQITRDKKNRCDTRFAVSKIAYDGNDNISELTIIDSKSGKALYNFSHKAKAEPKAETKAKVEVTKVKPEQPDRNGQWLNMMKKLGCSNQELIGRYTALCSGNILPSIPLKELTDEQFHNALSALEANFEAAS